MDRDCIIKLCVCNQEIINIRSKCDIFFICVRVYKFEKFSSSNKQCTHSRKMKMYIWYLVRFGMENINNLYFYHISSLHVHVHIMIMMMESCFENRIYTIHSNRREMFRNICWKWKLHIWILLYTFQSLSLNTISYK